MEGHELGVLGEQEMRAGDGQETMIVMQQQAAMISIVQQWLP